MAQLAFLLQDVLTMLAWLSAGDIRPLGTRYLSSSALGKLARLLVISDPIAINHPRKSNGTWLAGVRIGLSEKHTHRIRFIHYLTESAHLVARTGAFLKPTPATARWLAAPPSTRAQILFAAGFPSQPTRADEERWRAFGLPGTHLPAPLAAFQHLVEIFRHVGTDDRLKLSALVKLMGLPAFDDDAPHDQPPQILASWLELLEWFGILQRERRATVQLTAFGATLLGHPAASTTPSVSAGEPLHWSAPRGKMLPNLIAPRDADFACVFELSDYATHRATLASKTASRRVYQLDRARVQSALQRGRSFTQIYDCLERATAAPLPGVVADWLTEMAPNPVVSRQSPGVRWVSRCAAGLATAPVG